MKSIWYLLILGFLLTGCTKQGTFWTSGYDVVKVYRTGTPCVLSITPYFSDSDLIPFQVWAIGKTPDGFDCGHPELTPATKGQ